MPVGFKTREDAKRVMAGTRKIESIPGDATGEAQRTPQYVGETITARLTSQDTAEPWKYGWEEVRPDAVGYKVITDGVSSTPLRFGTTAERYAFEVNRRPTWRVGDIVHLRRAAIEQSAQEGPDGKPLPVEFKPAWQIVSDNVGYPQYPNQVLQGVAQNVRGWDNVRGHGRPG